MLSRIRFTNLSISSKVLLISVLLSGCSSLPEEFEHSPESKVAYSTSSLSELRDGQKSGQTESENSAVLLQNSGWEALSQRLALIEMAEQSIDIQYYIWNSDDSGRYLASRIIEAANRGVKVRVMLDDINLDEREDLLTSLNAHSNIEIRIFNPIPTRKGVSKWLRVLGDFSRLNRRMHNKTFTVDGVVSVVGGRNIGDEYFDLSDEINFRDRDAMVMGEVVGEIQSSFISYWDSRWSYPVELLGGEQTLDLSDIDKIARPHYHGYPNLPEDNEAAYHFLQALMPQMTWVQASFISDQPVPEDADDTSIPKETAVTLSQLVNQAKSSVTLESAYLIFDDRQLEGIKQQTNSGIEIKALTNSMVSNDLITNHSGYAGRRQDMLENGLQLFELKPDTALCESSTRDASKCAPITPYGLHTKSAVFDKKVAVIGSFNFNLRSTYLNTESLLIVEDLAIAEELANDITQAMNEENSWRLGLEEGDPRWYSGDKVWETEPETGRWERFNSRFLQLFPIEKYL
ncbi:phospholipase D family protein [Vibrio sp. ZSDE26]|uniref:Phospholipase D family protein n=1 Tax=Vibrio amylolyticus TaxID=2847292 RepID=A0A9X2BI87_9VIBR|nr:phospholipase D family protein [Vibrio amylolyticus]MCK6262132.1 phospholipase D family protein [Vibrio amylolyticus]